jgi:hypothetical protein
VYFPRLFANPCFTSKQCSAGTVNGRQKHVPMLEQKGQTKSCPTMEPFAGKPFFR